MQEAMDEVQMVVEGVYSAKAAVKLGEKYGVSLPIINKVSEVLFDGKDPKEAVNELMLRDNKAEAYSTSVGRIIIIKLFETGRTPGISIIV